MENNRIFSFKSIFRKIKRMCHLCKWLCYAVFEGVDKFTTPFEPDSMKNYNLILFDNNLMKCSVWNEMIAINKNLHKQHEGGD